MKVDRLTGSSNYSAWKFKLKHVLIAKDYFGYVDGSTVLAGDADDPTKTAYKKGCNKALSQI